MNLTIKSKGRVSLSKADFVASGGEGSVYRKGNTAFKIYTDPKRMLPPDKIRELSVLAMPNIIRPQDVLLDGGTEVGYTMRFVEDSYALCQLFTRAFRERMGIKPDTMGKLATKLQEIVLHCHQNRVLIVDLNELNFLVGNQFDEVFAIDCDSYQTKSFPATAIMDSIRDRQATEKNGRYKANENTDWFSFGIVSFQMYIGIHPYKGKHPTCKSLDERMDQNISVFNKEVSVPAVCYPLTHIPQAMRDWYKAVFEDGKRLPPPMGVLLPTIAVVATVRIAGSNNFTIKKIRVFKEDVVRFDPWTGLTTTTTGVHSEQKCEYTYSKTPYYALTTKGARVAISLEGNDVKLFDITRGIEIKPPMPICAEAIMSYGGRVYVKQGISLSEVELLEAGGSQVFAGSTTVCPVLQHATRLFDGVVVQDVFGSCYANVFPQSKTCLQYHIKELDGAKIIDAKYDNGVMMFVAFQGGKYNKYIVRTASDLSYDLRVEKDVGPVTLNFVTLPNGVCVHLNEKEEIEIFTNNLKSSSVKVYDDPALESDMRLSRDGTQVLFAKGNELHSIEVKRP